MRLNPSASRSTTATTSLVAGLQVRRRGRLSWGTLSERGTLWRSGRPDVEGVGTPRAGCGVSLRAEDCALGAGPTIYERSADA